MATDPFDFDGVIAQAGTDEDWRGMSPETVLGHMHLHVGDLHAATNFYQEVIGFDVMNADFPSARFLSTGGYHHHLGINTWNSDGAPPAPEHAIGLEYYTVVLPDEGSLNALQARLNLANTQLHETQGGIYVKDPSGNGIKFTSEGSD